MTSTMIEGRENGTATETPSGLRQEIEDLKKAQAVQAATDAGAHATQAATHAGTWTTMIAGAAGLVVGMFLAVALTATRS